MADGKPVSRWTGTALTLQVVSSWTGTVLVTRVLDSDVVPAPGGYPAAYPASY